MSSVSEAQDHSSPPTKRARIENSSSENNHNSNNTSKETDNVSTFILTEVFVLCFYIVIERLADADVVCVSMCFNVLNNAMTRRQVRVCTDCNLMMTQLIQLKRLVVIDMVKYPSVKYEVIVQHNDDRLKEPTLHHHIMISTHQRRCNIHRLGRFWSEDLHFST